MRHGERGARTVVVLLEALIALVILTTAGAIVVTMSAEAASAVRRARIAESNMRKANALFAALSIWSREDLDRHLGDRAEGQWILRVDRPAPAIYTAALTDTATHVELLRTSLYRPEVINATP